MYLFAIIYCPEINERSENMYKGYKRLKWLCFFVGVIILILAGLVGMSVIPLAIDYNYILWAGAVISIVGIGLDWKTTES
jgi:hypothetical protein